MLGSTASKTSPTASYAPSAPFPSLDDLPRGLRLEVEPEEDDALASQINVVLEMTATFDADGFQLPPQVTRRDVRNALLSADGNVSLAVDEVLSLVAIKALSQQDQQAASLRRHNDSRLQLTDLCSGLGLDECSAFVTALQALPESEKDGILSTNGGFVQQLLLTLDEEDSSEDGSEADDPHPLQHLLEMYPNYRAEIVEDVLDRHNYDVDAAAEALHNLRALNHVQSYATVVDANARTAARQHNLRANGPEVDSLGQFPTLNSSKTQQKKLRRQQRRQQKLEQEPHRPPPKPSPVTIAYPRLPVAKNTVKNKGAMALNAWGHQRAPNDRLEAGITTQLKLERLKSLLPSIGMNVIQTVCFHEASWTMRGITFFLNGCSSDATEAALREIFDLPLVEKPVPSVTEAEEAEMAVEVAEVEEAVQSNRRGRAAEDWTLVSSRRNVNAAKEALSDRYCAVLASFRRGQHVLAVDRVREHQRPIDLHGMIVMEALWVAREAIEYCQAQRIRRCLLICGVGHHSVNGKPRILTAVRLSLDRRQIAYRELHGLVTVFVLRSADTT
ncbi:hypothetical protein BBJ28_00007893 [Nothophytophthora sp. Chile5]|nr:hypothetical protein BBJ28_00007893 [Nothophytophthora sp. Chile5]